MRLYILLTFLFFSVVPLDAQNPIITIGQEVVPEGGTVSVPVSVENFNDVVSIQFTLQWDPTIVTYQNTGDYGLPGMSEFNFGETDISNGRLTFVWFDGQVNGLTLPAGSVIFSVAFLAVGDLGDSSPVSFVNAPTPIQIGVINGLLIEEIDGTYVDGEVQIISVTILASATITSNSCFGESQGSITTTVEGGLPAYDFNWTGPNNFTSTDPSLENLPAGNYALTITDQYGTTYEDNFVVSEPPIIQVDDIQLQQSNCDSPTGSIALTVSGGMPGYLYDFGDGFSSDPTMDQLAAGNYLVQIQDNLNCVIDTLITILESDDPEIMLAEDFSLCPDDTATLTASTDQALTYSWTLDGMPIAPTTNEITVTETGLYAVSASNAAGCTATDEVMVSAAILPLLDLGPDTSFCPKTIFLLLANEDFMDYSWSVDGMPTGTNAPELAVLNEGLFMLDALTEDGCEMSDTIAISLIPFPTSVGPDTTIFSGQPLTLLAEGGIAYNWTSNVDLSCTDCPAPLVTLDATTTFLVDITSAEGCVVTETLTINVEEAPELLIDLVNFLSPNGDGKNDVLIFRGLENYRRNQLSIFNRWGDLIFSKPNYQMDGIYWDATWNGQPLPPGIYYYVLNIDVASKPIKSALTIVID